MLVVLLLLIKALSVIGLWVAGPKNGQVGLIDACSQAVNVQRKYQGHYWWLRQFKCLCWLGSMRPKILQNCAQQGLFRFAVPLQGWLWKPFVTDHHWGWNVDPYVWTADRKSISGMASSSLLGMCSLKLPLQRWVMATFVVCRWGDFGRQCATWSDH
jgi:hypothetical protein